MAEASYKLGRYLLTEEIARGGMGVVYRATLVGAAGFAKPVAIKQILPEWSSDPDFVAMLVAEAKLLVELNHPNIVQVLELGHDNNTLFLALEYVDGMDLRTLLKTFRAQQKHLPEHLCAHIAAEACRALAFTHNRSEPIIHRDVSPQNILISRNGAIKLTDFGIAKILGKTTKTHTGQLKGKFSYMSPEQAEGQKLDPRSDLFAIGAIVFEMLAGEKCFDGESDWEILRKIRAADWPKLKRLPSPIDQILKRVLAQNPDERYSDAASLCRDLEGWRSCDAQTAELQLAKLIGELLPNQNKSQSEQNDHKTLTPLFARSKNSPTLENTQIAEPTLLTQIKSQPKIEKKKLTFRKNTFLLVASLALAVLSWQLIPEQTQPIALHATLSGRDLTPAPPQTLPAVAPQILPTVSTLAAPSPLALTLPPKPAAIGTVQVDVRPWGVAQIAGFAAHNAPTNFTLPEGTHKLIVSYPPQKLTLAKTITIKADQKISCRASFGQKKGLWCQ